MNYIFLGPEHITSMLIILAVWVITPLWGLKLNQWQIQFVATLLAVLTVFKLKIGKYAIHRTVLLTLFLMIFISIFNYFTSSNYFFLCEKPDGPSPFLVGEWPVYVISLIFFGIAIMWILDVLVKRVQRFI